MALKFDHNEPNVLLPYFEILNRQLGKLYGVFGPDKGMAYVMECTVAAGTVSFTLLKLTGWDLVCRYTDLRPCLLNPLTYIKPPVVHPFVQAVHASCRFDISSIVFYRIVSK